MMFLKTIDSDGISARELQWPLEVGTVVEAPDWNSSPNHNSGLRGLLNGEGPSEHLQWDINSIWIVFENITEEIVHVNGQWKMRKAKVLHVGDQQSATQFLYDNIGDHHSIHGITIIKDQHNECIIGGNKSYIKSGIGGCLLAGYYSSAYGGDFSTSITKDFGISAGGSYSTAISGDHGQSITEVHGFSKSGNRGYSETRDQGLAISGYAGTSIVGKYGIAITEQCGTVKGGPRAILQIKHLNLKNEEVMAIAYVGENNIEENTMYRLDRKSNFRKVAK